MIDFEQGVWFYSSALAAAVPVMIPALQFGFIYKIWDKYNKKVDRHNCRNTCWDTVFKGEWILTRKSDLDTIWSRISQRLGCFPGAAVQCSPSTTPLLLKKYQIPILYA